MSMKRMHIPSDMLADHGYKRMALERCKCQLHVLGSRVFAVAQHSTKPVGTGACLRMSDSELQHSYDHEK